MGNGARSCSSSHCLFRRWELRSSSKGQTRSSVVGPCRLVPLPLLPVHASVFLPQQHRSAWPSLILCYFSLSSFLLHWPSFFPFLILHGWLLNLFIIMFSPCIGMWLIYSACVSFRCTWSDSVIRIHVFTLSRILFPCRLIQNIEYRFLCYIVGPRWLSVLYMIVCIGKSQNPHLSPW